MSGRVIAEEIAWALAGRAGLAWLDGDGAHGEEGRWSFLGAEPVDVRRVAWGAERPLDAIARLSGADDDAAADVSLPIAPGRVPRWIGYVAYDAAWSGRTRTTARLARDSRLPVAWFGRYDALVAIDHVSGEAWIVGDDTRALDALDARIANGREEAAARGRPRGRALDVRTEAPEVHAASIRAALAHIAAGDIYQVNLARRWSARWEGDALALYLAMRAASPVPLGMFVDAGDHAVLARTMERFVRWDGPGGRIVSRPIKGTIARAAATGASDAVAAATLRADDKERAEHVMIVDLVRNDLGRVAEIGSVRLEDVMTVEPYAKLSHLVTTVCATTRNDVTLGDVLDATFPPGSVTGAPKVRAVEIIEELERVQRGVYTGAVGFVDRAGGASLAVAIRTAVRVGDELWYHAGGGLVSASVPEKEVAETELKARVFFDAIERLGEW